MKAKRIRRFLVQPLLLAALAFIAACSANESTQTAAPTAALDRETEAATQTASATPAPSDTLLAPTETVRPSETPFPILESRNPSLEEIQAYLASIGLGGGLNVVELLIEDVTGDGRRDLIAVSEAAPVFVFIWEEEGRYSTPSVVGSWEEGLDGADGRYLYLKDYTGDRVPEIVNDSWRARGEATYTIVDWERHIYYCESGGCRAIWEDWIASYADAPTSTGMFYYNSSDYVYRNDQLDLILERRYFGFTIFWPYIGQEREPVLSQQYNAAAFGWDTDGKFYKDAEIIRRYIWNGEAYEFLEDEVVTFPELIERDAALEAVSPDGARAFVRLEQDLSSETYRNDRCQVYLNGEPISQPFGCKHEFTRVYWDNIVPQGKAELIVTTISGDQSRLWTDLVAQKGCFHQRLLIFLWDGRQASQAANVVGCVRRSTLFGARLTDYDEDGNLEILAAVMWPQFLERQQPDGVSQDYMQVSQLVEIYEWDGERFVIGWTLNQ